ncbi:MAG TPA: transglutaminase family protein [Bryobacteraceae bacterium]|nr:transglutaminase family protein [Bryobacteraceae bacterium]
MFYSIRHLTKFRYSSPVSESIMELRMQPRSEGVQRCLSFELSVTPRTRVQFYRDYLSNVVHHFDVPGAHRQLTILAEAMVDVSPSAPLPERLNSGAWQQLREHLATADFWEMLAPSQFAHWSQLTQEFAAEIGVPDREAAEQRDPLELLYEINSILPRQIAYAPKSTRVDSPADDALRNRQGVCQDFAHIMIALVRRMGIPCRYVSGYLFRKAGSKTRSTEGATHAWIEAFLPELGWVGFDPTNDVIADESHVRTAVGRDYADVAPTRGVFKGDASSELTVAVRVAPSDKPPPPEAELESEDWSEVLQGERAESDPIAAEQQQQQQ